MGVRRADIVEHDREVCLAGRGVTWEGREREGGETGLTSLSQSQDTVREVVSVKRMQTDGFNEVFLELFLKVSWQELVISQG